MAQLQYFLDEIENPNKLVFNVMNCPYNISLFYLIEILEYTLIYIQIIEIPSIEGLSFHCIEMQEHHDNLVNRFLDTICMYEMEQISEDV